MRSMCVDGVVNTLEGKLAGVLLVFSHVRLHLLVRLVDQVLGVEVVDALLERHLLLLDGDVGDLASRHIDAVLRVERDIGLTRAPEADESKDGVIVEVRARPEEVGDGANGTQTHLGIDGGGAHEEVVERQASNEPVPHDGYQRSLSEARARAQAGGRRLGGGVTDSYGASPDRPAP